MSSIAGFVQDGPLFQRTHIYAMLQAMSHRNTNGVGVWHSPQVSLGLGLNGTTIEEQQILEPWQDYSRRIVLDGRLDNRSELISLLDIPQDTLPSDHQIILEAYLKWGTSCLSRLEGDFSFALWDGNQLFCGRDRLGAKPFLYYQGKGFFSFASEAKALLILPEVKGGYDEAWLGNFFFPGLQQKDQEATPYRGIYRLPPAHGMILRRGRIRIFPYWKLSPPRVRRFTQEQEYFEAFQASFRSSVTSRLRGALPAASALSGGLDSSGISAVAAAIYRDNNQNPLPTFSCVFPGTPESDESQWIKILENHAKVDPHRIFPEQVDPLEGLEEMIQLHEGPFWGPNFYLQKEIYKGVRQEGYQIFLDGEDGDGVISHGYDFFQFLAEQGLWEDFFEESDLLVEGFQDEKAFFSRDTLFRFYGFPFLRNLLIRGDFYNLYKHINRIHQATDLSRKKLLRYLFNPPRIRRPVQGLLRDGAGKLFSMQRALKSLNREDLKYVKGFNSFHYKGIVQSGYNDTQEFFDRTASYYGIQVRHPFYDHKLAELVLSFPPDIKLRQGLSRYYYRESMKGLLPESLRLRRDKGDLGPALIRGLRHYSMERISDVINSIPRNDSFIEREKALTRLKQFREGDDTAALDCWMLTVYQTWRLIA